MKINELVVHESKLYYLEQLYLEEGFASGLGNVADAIGKGVGSLPGLIAGAGNKFAQGFGGGYHDTKSAVIGQPSQPKTAAPAATGTATGIATGTATSSTTTFQQVQVQASKLSIPEKQKLIRVLQKLIQRSTQQPTQQPKKQPTQQPKKQPTAV